jgi:hypothetical protein
VALDVLDALPDNSRLAQERVVRRERVERRVIGRGRLVENGEVRVAEERDERAGRKGGGQREEAVVG